MSNISKVNNKDTRIMSCVLLLILIRCCTLFYCNNTLFHMKITVSVTKSLHQNHGLCYLHLTSFFSFTYTLLFCNKIKICCDWCFPQQIIPKTMIQLYIYYENILVWGLVSLSITNTTYTLPIVYTCQFEYVQFKSLLFYSELNEVHGSYV